MTLFAPGIRDGRLTHQAKVDVFGAPYFIELRFEAALRLENYYSLRVETSWAEEQAINHEYFRKSSEGWFSFWTRGFTPVNPPDTDAGSPERYHELCDAALSAESHLDSVAAIQQAIIAGLKSGGRYGIAHKEGGTNIFWRDGEFVRSDYGEYPDHKEFSNEAEFMKMLRQFCHGDAMPNNSQEQRSDFDTWKLVLRRLRLNES